MQHFHIRWSGAKLDWEELMRPGEKFTVEQFGHEWLFP